MTSKELWQEVRLMWDSGDPWGEVMQWWFTIAAELYWNRDDVDPPDNWAYHPSPLGNDNDPDDYHTVIVRELDTPTLLRFGRAMHRYAGMLKKAGRDY